MHRTKPSASSRLRDQIVRFGAVGALVTGVDLVLLNGLLMATGGALAFPLVKTISTLVAATVSYMLNQRFTFATRTQGDVPCTSVGDDNRAGRVAAFALVTGLGGAANICAASVAFSALAVLPPVLPTAWDATVAALVGTAAGMVWNFMGYRTFVFSGARAAPIAAGAGSARGSQA